MPVDNTIVSAKIHPGIGIARVGNSEDEYFIGPEVPCPVPHEPGYYRDCAGALKRQAARFRIYGYNRKGEVVKELTAEDASIEWTVEIANKKAAWYNFELAMDIPQAIPVRRRNANFVGKDRQQLAITPAPISIKGTKQQSKRYQFDDGKFLGEEIYLGELRTDEAGRLIFLGGRGVAKSPFPNNTAITFANNDGWYDDTSDGSVRATLIYKNQEIPVEPAWVVTAPPNYAPGVISVVTMYDLMYDTFVGKWLQPPTKPSFTEHIYPLLQQFAMAQWVNKGFFVQYGWGAPYDFMDPELLAKLSFLPDGKDRDEYQELRRQIFHAFRDPNSDNVNVNGWPWVYGDNVQIPAKDANAFLAITKTQYNFLQAWVEGKFDDDWHPDWQPPQSLDEIELHKQPDELDKAALWFCLGGPFHPGCEMTWPMRHETMYYAPFRIRPRSPQDPEPDYGEFLKPKIFQSSVSGEYPPIFANAPGDITRWMAIPWQTDTSSCRAGYDTKYDPYIPTFWPARVPNHVLTEEDYKIVIDQNQPKDKRLAAFNRRAVWYRFLGQDFDYIDQINKMITDFGNLGVVEYRKGVDDDSDFPPVMYVETEPNYPHQVKNNTPLDCNLIIGAVEKVTRHQNPQQSDDQQ